MNLSEEQVVRAIKPERVINPAERVFTNFSFDSRLIEEGGLFFALKGQRDGHLFVEDAISRGALAAVVERPVGDFPQFVVKDTLKALGELASSTLGEEERIGITGSAGKTTTKLLAHALLARDYSVEASPGNWNNLIGVPTFLLNRQGSELLVVEMGISLPGEMETLVKIARPTASLITRIYPVHTETLGNVENIAKEKGEILSSARRAAFNLDDPYQRSLMEKFEGEKRTFSRSRRADVALRGWKRVGIGELVVEVSYLGRELSLRFPFWSPVFIENLLAALAISSFFLKSEPSLEGVKPLQGRGRVLRCGDLWIIDESYNSNPSAAMLSLMSLSSLEGRKIAVLADMLELDQPEQEHREFGKKASMLPIDLFVFVGPLMKFAFEEASKKRDGVYWVERAEEATGLVRRLLKGGEIIFFKGSHGTGLWKEVEKWT